MSRKTIVYGGRTIPRRPSSYDDYVLKDVFDAILPELTTECGWDVEKDTESINEARNEFIDAADLSEDKHYGLTINEQAFAMWITCRFNTNPEICTAHIMGGLEAKCPFVCKCDDVDQKMWVEFLKQREVPCPKN